MSITYIRAKRKNQTVFITVKLQQTIGDVKKALSSIVETPVENIRLLNISETVLEEDKKLSDYKIENDSVIYWVQKEEGSDEWEKIDIQKVELPKTN